MPTLPMCKDWRMKRDGVGSVISQFCSRLLQNQEGTGMVGLILCVNCEGAYFSLFSIAPVNYGRFATIKNWLTKAVLSKPDSFFSLLIFVC